MPVRMTRRDARRGKAILSVDADEHLGEWREVWLVGGRDKKLSSQHVCFFTRRVPSRRQDSMHFCLSLPSKDWINPRKEQ